MGPCHKDPVVEGLMLGPLQFTLPAYCNGRLEISRFRGFAGGRDSRHNTNSSSEDQTLGVRGLEYRSIQK